MAKGILARNSVLAILALSLFIPGFARYQELRQKNEKLERAITQLESDLKRLEAEKKRLETDITYIEKKAREKIGVVRTGEVVIKK